MVSATTTAHDVRLSCEIARVDDNIVFTYQLANQGEFEVFVMDADLAVDPATQQRSADVDAATTWLGADGYAQVLKGVPALPAGVEAQTRIMPLAARLAPGEQCERRLVQPMPLVERSPYAPPGLLREYRIAPIHGVALSVDVMQPAAPGMVVPARDVGPDWWRVTSEEDVLVFHRLACAFRARGLHMMVRTDDYPRPD